MDGDRLRELRRRKALALRELAERSGVHLQTISRIENHRAGAHPSTIRKLADALGVEPEELVGGGSGRFGWKDGDIAMRSREGEEASDG